MENEEEYLINKMGKKTPFTVPEGYFDQFAERLMDQLPDSKPKKAIVYRLRPWLYAAMFAGLLGWSASLFFSNDLTDADKQKLAAAAAQQPTTETTAQTYSDNYIEDAANYAMIDNEEIYAYLADL